MQSDLKPLLEAVLESVEETKNRLTEIERIIDRQGLSELKPGTVVDKDFCDVEHAELKDSVCGRASKLEKSTNSKIYATWVVLLAILTWFGTEISMHSKAISEIIKTLAVK